MIRLPYPIYRVRNIASLCAASIRDASIKERLGECATAFEAAENECIVRGEAGQLHLIGRDGNVGGMLTTKDMSSIYSDTFVKSVKTRIIYDNIKKLPPNDICPICGQRTVFSLDHYLPQAHYPCLTLVPVNLVPACLECNKLKLDAIPTTAAEQTIHPYFDNFDVGKWLHATVIESKPASLLFFASPPDEWEDTSKKRVTLHFKTFGLGTLYASHSAVEMRNTRFSLQQLAKRHGASEIREHLKSVADGCRDEHPNSWQTAMYEALSTSDWFCGGGFDN